MSQSLSLKQSDRATKSTYCSCSVSGCFTIYSLTEWLACLALCDSEPPGFSSAAVVSISDECVFLRGTCTIGSWPRHTQPPPHYPPTLVSVLRWNQWCTVQALCHRLDRRDRNSQFSNPTVQSGEESGGPSCFKIVTVIRVEMDLILVLFERDKIAKMNHYLVEACFKKGSIMERKKKSYL